MKRFQKELLSLKNTISIYKRIRKNPQEYATEWMFEKKGKGYVDWYQNHRDRLIQFNDKYKDQDCFIVGNGPSLNKMDLEPLNDYYTFGLNKIFLLFKRSNFRPKFHVSVNKLVLDQSMDEILGLNIPSFLSFRNIENKIINENINYLYTNGGVNKFTGDLTKQINEGGTVTYIAMQIAYYMGFRRVFLIGVDHSFTQRGKANEEQVMEEEDVNHFDPNYFKGQKWNLADLDSSEYAYHLAKYAYEFDHRNIMDATVDGKLTIFNKISYEKALSEAGKINAHK